MNILSAVHVLVHSVIQYSEINIDTGKVTFIQGESGCGKSTLLRLFNGTLSPESGELLFKGKNINTMDTIELRQKVLLAGQSVYLFQKSIEENFNEFYRYREEPVISREKMMDFLSLCCLEFPLDTDCGKMSGGERQRVYLAICLSFQPQVLMLDEPTSALDENTAHNLLYQLKKYCLEHGITLLIVSHDATLAKQFADSIIELKKAV